MPATEPYPLDTKSLNFIRGRHSVGFGITHDDAAALFDHISALEALLDEGDQEDAFGTEGWRHRLGID